jgi:radical SAM-linked protein
MTAPAHSPAPAAVRPPAFRVAFRYRLEGDLRYLSHRDELRMLRRALARAGWPLRFSRGYNPMPWLSVPLPRRVGVASDCQLALTELSEPRSVPQLWGGLAAALPDACRLQALHAPAPAGTPHPQAAEYAVSLPLHASSAVTHIVERWRTILETDEERRPGEVNLPPAPKCKQYLERVAWDGSELRLRLRFVEQRTARLSEVLTELGLAPEPGGYAVRLCEVAWNMEFSGPNVKARASKGIAIGHKEDRNQSNKEQN